MDNGKTDSQVLLARQSIVDEHKDFFGYELLYRDSGGQYIPSLAPEGKTAQVLINRLTGLSIDEHAFSNEIPLFVNMNSDLLLNDNFFEMLYPNLIIEISPESNKSTIAILHLKKEQKDKLNLSLDNYHPDSYSQELLEAASYIKIDIQSVGIKNLPKLLNGINNFPGKIVFKNIETYKEFEYCKQLKGDLFQGWFINKPQLIKGNLLSSNRQASLNLLAELYSKDITTISLEKAISSDLMLTTQLLRLINSASFGIPRKINTIAESIVFMGIEKLRQWAGLLILSGEKSKPQELIKLNIVRAKFCENIATVIGDVNPQQAFLVGLLSMIDAYMDVEIDKLLEQLPLADKINQALSLEEGALGDLLFTVKQYEKAEWETLKHQELAESVFCKSYLSAIQWADETFSLMRNLR